MARPRWRWLLALAVVLMLGNVAPGRGAADAELQASSNRVGNGGFETGGSAWQVCGGARRIDALVEGGDAVHSGRFAMRIGNPMTSPTCPLPPADYAYSPVVPQAMSQPIAIPPTATAISVRFWYRVEGSARADLDLFLAPNLYNSWFAPEGAYLGRVASDLLPGWQEFRRVLQPAELQRVRGKTLLLSFQIAQVFDGTLSVLIDDVELTLTEMRTNPEPLPAALRGDGTRPLAFVRGAPGNSHTRHLYRMDTDGDALQFIYPGQRGFVGDPQWSQDGTRIAVIDHNTYAPDDEAPDASVPATALTILRSTGGNAQAVYQTTGRLRTTSDVERSETVSHIQQLTNLAWAPDDSRIAGAIVAYERMANGRTRGTSVRIEVIQAATGKATRVLDGATGLSWSPTDRLLFEAAPASGDDRAPGVWEWDAKSNRANARHLLAPDGPDQDGSPVWRPDGSSFVTIRPTASERYTADGATRRNQALMLWSRQDLSKPRLLLLADLGTIAEPTWSPDGRYLVYTLSQDERPSATDLWWLDVESGATGPLTSDGLSSNAHWRPNRPASSGTIKVYIPYVKR